MSVKRIGTTARWSDAVIHNNTVYLVEVPSNLDGNINEQAKNLLSSIESRLIEVGSSKSKILMATIYLSTINHIGAFNEIWDAWLPAGTAPVRACVEARLANPAYLVEIQLTAALDQLTYPQIKDIISNIMRTFRQKFCRDGNIISIAFLIKFDLTLDYLLPPSFLDGFYLYSPLIE